MRLAKQSGYFVSNKKFIWRVSLFAHSHPEAHSNLKSFFAFHLDLSWNSFRPRSGASSPHVFVKRRISWWWPFSPGLYSPLPSAWSSHLLIPVGEKWMPRIKPSNVSAIRPVPHRRTSACSSNDKRWKWAAVYWIRRKNRSIARVRWRWAALRRRLDDVKQRYHRRLTKKKMILLKVMKKIIRLLKIIGSARNRIGNNQRIPFISYL